MFPAIRAEEAEHSSQDGMLFIRWAAAEPPCSVLCVSSSQDAMRFLDSRETSGSYPQHHANRPCGLERGVLAPKSRMAAAAMMTDIRSHVAQNPNFEQDLLRLPMCEALPPHFWAVVLVGHYLRRGAWRPDVPCRTQPSLCWQLRTV